MCTVPLNVRSSDQSPFNAHLAAPTQTNRDLQWGVWRKYSSNIAPDADIVRPGFIKWKEKRKSKIVIWLKSEIESSPPIRKALCALQTVLECVKKGGRKIEDGAAAVAASTRPLSGSIILQVFCLAKSCRILSKSQPILWDVSLVSLEKISYKWP